MAPTPVRALFIENRNLVFIGKFSDLSRNVFRLEETLIPITGEFSRR